MVKLFLTVNFVFAGFFWQYLSYIYLLENNNWVCLRTPSLSQILIQDHVLLLNDHVDIFDTVIYQVYFRHGMLVQALVDIFYSIVAECKIAHGNHNSGSFMYSRIPSQITKQDENINELQT